jgi:hypothetical protein
MIALMHAVRLRSRWSALALVVGIALQGCAARAPDAASRPESGADLAQAGAPPGAVRIGDQLYQMPIGADDDGCPRYRLYSPTRLVAQVIYYRDRAGGFTTDRRQAACAGRGPD